MAATLLQAKKLCATNADNGLNQSDPRLVDRINEAQRRLLRHYNFIIRKEDYDKTPLTYAAKASDGDELLVDDLDATKLMVLALWREENNAFDAATALEQRAHALVEESLIATVEAAQKAAWKTALSTYGSTTWGHFKARLGLDLADVMLRYSDARVGRFINAAEEALMQKGKPVGSIDGDTIAVPEDGLVTFPSNVETVLYAAFDNIPLPIYRRAYEWLANGPGLQTNDDMARGWPAVMIPRGQDADGARVYFVRQPAGATDLQYLAKLKFVPKTTSTDKMTVKNFPAIKEMVLSQVKAATDPLASEAHEIKALRFIDEELAEHRGGEQGVSAFQVRGAARPVRAPR